MSSNQVVPPALANTTVSWGRRVAARLITSLPPAVAATVVVLYAAGMLRTLPLMALGAAVGLTVIWSITNLVIAGLKSKTIGSSFLKFDYRLLPGGEPAGWRLCAKLILSDVLVLATVGIMGIVLLATYRDGQHLVDRWLGVRAVDPAKILKEQSPTPYAGPRVQPVALPPLVSRSPNQGNSWDSAGVNQPTTTPAPMGVPMPIPGPHEAIAPATSPQSMLQAAEAPQGSLAGGWSSVQVPKQTSPVQGNNQPALIERSPFAPKNNAPAAPVPMPPMVASVPAVGVPLSAEAGEQPKELSDETVIDEEQHTLSRAPKLLLDDLTTIDLAVPVVLGRNPVAPAAYRDARVQPVVDESMRVSKTHCVVFAEDAAVKIYDVGSRNGVFFEIEGNKTKIAATEPIEIPEGAVVHFGGRTLRVTR